MEPFNDVQYRNYWASLKGFFMRIKDWQKFQHFKDRKPIWIKLYRDILDDPEWSALDGDSAKVLVMLWLLASEYDGYLPDIKTISFRLRMTEKKINEHISKLNHWVMADDINLISECHQDDAPEKRRDKEEAEREKRALTALVWKRVWEIFPRQRRGSEQKALIAWESAIKRETPENILAGCIRYAASKDVADGFAKGCQAWLNDDGWTYCAPRKSETDDSIYRGVMT